MTITRQFLEQQIADLQTQVSVFTGAIQFAQMLLGKMDSTMGIPINEFAEMVAGAGATASIEPVESDKMSLPQRRRDAEEK